MFLQKNKKMMKKLNHSQYTIMQQNVYKEQQIILMIKFRIKIKIIYQGKLNKNIKILISMINR